MIGVAASVRAKPSQAGPYSWYALFILSLAYTLSYLDRQVLTLLIDPIRSTLSISDTQISLLHGFAFAIFYTVLGLPLGRLVDQHRRTTIIATGVALWSIMTALCGLARSYGQMFVARVGVGIGEASLTPGAYSLLSDYFDPRTRPIALSLYLSAIYVGSGLAMIVGGTLIGLMPAIDAPIVGQLEAWQGVFIVVGLPGLLVALWILTMREPVRTGVKENAAPSIGGALRHVADHRKTFALVIMGYSAFNLMWNCGIAWYPTLLIREFGWTAPQVGWRFGLVLMASGGLGVIFGGYLSTLLRKAGLADGNLVAGIIAAIIALPAGLISGLLGGPWLTLGTIFIFQFGCAMPFGAAAAALQEITPNQFRGQITAIYQFMSNMFGIGLGPTLVALINDHAYGGDGTLGLSIVTGIAISGPVCIVLLASSRARYRQSMISLAA